MKKMAMKKWIPRNTPYCGSCKWRNYYGTIKLDKTNCEHSKTCNDTCWSSPETSCQVSIIGCKYLGIVDKTEDTLLWDGCKECEIE